MITLSSKQSAPASGSSSITKIGTLVSGTVPISLLGNYPNDVTKVLKGDGTWTTVSTGTPTSNRQSFVATASQTSFTINYLVGFVDVFVNGVKLTPVTDFTATNGTSVVLLTAAAVGDNVDIIAGNTFDVANAYTRAETDSRIQSVVGAAPAALDTLNELAAALGNDANYATTITNALAGKSPIAGSSSITTIGTLTSGTVPTTLIANYPNDATKVLKGDGSWQTMSGGSGLTWDSGVVANLGQLNESTTGVSLSVKAVTPFAGKIVTHSISASNLPVGLSLDAVTGLITGSAPNLTANTVFTFTVSANDTLSTITREFTLTILATNDAPTWTSNASIGAVTTTSFQLDAIDAEGTTLTYLLIGSISPALTGFAISSHGLCSFTANALDGTSYSFTASVSDGVNAVNRSFSFTTGGFIPGTQGFGVGTYTGTLPTGVTVLTGTTDVTSSNYGNYTFTDGSIMCWIPRFYYRIGSSSSPRFATYGANAIDIVSVNTYSTETAANAAGFAMHRAFVDGGAVKNGFFIDKYLASKNGSTSAKSVANAAPISLTTSANYTPSSTMTGCTGILADAVVLSRARGTGFNTATIFQYNALAMLSLAHAQETARLLLGTTYCAWYDPTYNFPKGCNNGALKDVNDTTVVYTQATGESATNKPNTGSASPFAKTTHNGQANGVADLNGCIYQVMLGITAAGTTATDTSNISTGDQYVLKHSATHASLTGGWGGTTDAWGTASSLLNNYDLITGFMSAPTGSEGWKYLGNGSNGVFAADIATSSAVASTAKTNYLKTCSGLPLSTGESTVGTNQYGADGNYKYTISNQGPIGSGYWGDNAYAGVFFRHWNRSRSDAGTLIGFRVAAYL